MAGIVQSMRSLSFAYFNIGLIRQACPPLLKMISLYTILPCPQLTQGAGVML